MREAGQPWAVSSLAQAAGVAALDETEYADHVRSLIARERPRMIASLRSLGLRVLEGQANFLLFKAPEDFGERLKEKGAVVQTTRGSITPGTAPPCARRRKTKSY